MDIRKYLSILLVAVLIFSSVSVLAEPIIHKVVKGDTLWDIGRKYNVPWGDLAELNGITNVRLLQIGTLLEIPGTSVTPEDPTPPLEEPEVEEPALPEDMALYDEFNVSIPHNDYETPGILSMPRGEGPFPAVVMLHGTGSEKDEAGGGYKLAAMELAKAGIASIRIDFIGNGESKEDYINYNFDTAVDDANAAFNYLASLHNIDQTRIGIMGWSQGGTIALLAAGQNRSFQSVVTWAGSTDLKSIGTEENYEIAKRDGYYNMTFDWREPLKLGLKWFDDVYNTDVLKMFSYSDAPVLAINGAIDDVVEPVNARLIVSASKNDKSKELILDGADHTFNIFTGDLTSFNQLTKATTDWFAETLKPVYKVDIVNIQNGDRIVPATVVVPVGEGPFPAVVINHGHGGNREENGGFAGMAEVLANQGILSIRMDFPGGGDSTEPFTENYMSNMISDSNKSLNYILDNYNIDKDRLGILGYSMGGRLALLIASEENSPYKAVGLLAPAASPGKDLLEGLLGGKENVDLYYKEASGEKGYADFTTIYGQEQQLSKKWFDDMVEFNPLKDISNFTGNILVLYGDKDVVVTPEINELVLDAYEKSTGLIMLGADHGYGFYSNQPDVTELVEDKFTEFFRENLR